MNKKCNCAVCKSCGQQKRILSFADKRQIHARNAKRYSDWFLQTAELQMMFMRIRKRGY